MDSFAYLTIASYEGQEKYKLTFLIDDNGTPNSPSLSFMFNGEEEIWDNEEYLDKLYKTLRNTIFGESIHPFDLVIHELIDYKMYKDKEVLLDIFERAIKLGVWEK